MSDDFDIERFRLRFWLCDQPHENIVEYVYHPYSKASPHNSKHLFDIYFLTHVFWVGLIGLLIKEVLFNRVSDIAPVAFIVGMLFEIYENLDKQIIKYRRIEIDSQGNTSYRGDSFINILGDLIGNAVGLWIGTTLSTNSTVSILVILFVWITRVVGFGYWTDFLKYLFVL